jgi:hypothetical protein
MCLGVSSLRFVHEVPKFRIFFGTGSEKAKSLKIFFSRTVSATGEQTPVLESLRGPFSSLFEATSCDRYFSDYASESAKV